MAITDDRFSPSVLLETVTRQMVVEIAAIRLGALKPLLTTDFSWRFLRLRFDRNSHAHADLHRKSAP